MAKDDRMVRVDPETHDGIKKLLKLNLKPLTMNERPQDMKAIIKFLVKNELLRRIK